MRKQKKIEGDLHEGKEGRGQEGWGRPNNPYAEKSGNNDCPDVSRKLSGKTPVRLNDKEGRETFN